MLAYLFWHRPRPGVERAGYEQAQRDFHAALDITSACFRLQQLPFDAPDGPPPADAPAESGGYEDWYLVADWTELGALNAAALDARRRARHDRAASLSGRGWGAVYAHVRGPAAIPGSARWSEKPRGTSLERALASVPKAAPVWQRQLVLGPAPELCLGDPGPTRPRVWPT